MALSRGLRLHQYLDDWLIKSQPREEAQVNTQAVVDLTQFLGWFINQEKSELKPTQVFSFVGYEYHLDVALVKPTQERWLKLQDLILRLKSKHAFGDVCTPVENHDLVPSLPHNIESQIHSRLSQYDGRPPVQVPPSSVDRMVFTSTGVQANLPNVVHSSCGPVCHSSEPQTPSIRVSYPRPQAWDIDALNIN